MVAIQNVHQCQLVFYKGLFWVLYYSLYNDELNLAIKHCKVHHFADDTNLLCTNNSIKKLNKMLNKDLKNLTNRGVIESKLFN